MNESQGTGGINESGPWCGGPADYASRVGNFAPIDPIELAEKAGVSLDEALAFFEREFGGFDKYIQACADREELGFQLARMNGDLQ